ncbi:MAG: hypothetical protein V1262_00850, partial [Alphaproteobacteria bacterium]|nr:hypothetical protein [Alphaproteobacteria bacterium]
KNNVTATIEPNDVNNLIETPHLVNDNRAVLIWSGSHGGKAESFVVVHKAGHQGIWATSPVHMP